MNKIKQAIEALERACDDMYNAHVPADLVGEALAALRSLQLATADHNYTPDELIVVLEHTLIPVDTKKKHALFALLDALQKPDATADTESSAAQISNGRGSAQSEEADTSAPVSTSAAGPATADQTPPPKIDKYGDEDKEDALACILFGRHVNSQNIGEIPSASLWRIRDLQNQLAAANARIAQIDEETKTADDWKLLYEAERKAREEAALEFSIQCESLHDRLSQETTARQFEQARNDAAERERDALQATLQNIEMETRDGGQWTLAEVNEVARAALAKQEQPHA